MQKNQHNSQAIPNPTIKKQNVAKKMWSNLSITIVTSICISTLFINAIIVSKIIWPNDPYHAFELGLIIGISSWVNAISGLFFGWMADKYSRKLLLFVVGIVNSIGLLFNGLIPTSGSSATFALFFTCNLLRGIALGGTAPIMNSYSSDKLEEDQKSQFFGVYQAIFQLFQITGMIVSALFFQNNYWKEFFILLGIINLIVAILIIAKDKEPKRAGTRKELKEVLSSNEVEYNFKLNKETTKETILKPTNIIAFIEGIFTTIMIGVPDFLSLPYLQSAPYNLSPFITSIVMVIFGLPGGILGSLFFAKLSDKAAKKNLKNRIYFITISLLGLYAFYAFMFNLNLPSLTTEQGNNLGYILSKGKFWLVGLLVFLARAIMGLYNINQPPILQSINLPEAQGKITSANQFLESIGYGLGSMMSGFILIKLNYNYQAAILITMAVGSIGALCWLFGLKYINNDAERISKILKERAELLNNQKNHEE